MQSTIRRQLVTRSVAAASASKPSLARAFVHVPRLPPAQSSASSSSPFSLCPRQPLGPVRWLQSGAARAGGDAWKSNKDITYEEVKKIAQQPNDDIILVDVREPDEVILGSVPSSVNIPLSKFEKALEMDGGDFTKTFGFHKPDHKQKLVFYCKTGKRSASALSLAKSKGFTNVRNYTGSWADWSSREQKED